MRIKNFLKPILVSLLMFGSVLGSLAADAHGGEGEHHSLPAHAVEIGSLGPFVLTNSMLVVIAVTALLVVVAQVVSRDVREVPGPLQNAVEWVVEGLYGFLEGIVGPDLIKKTFWFFGTIFIFILVTNWFGLVPGVGTVGWDVVTADGHEFRPWLRGGNADLNMTTAMSLIFFALWFYWAYQANGAKGFFLHIFGNKGGGKGFMMFFMIAIFAFVGVLETISILFRPVALSFRLFGNVFAGENILESMLMIVPWLGWLVPLPFYFLELLVGLVQALVFTLLTAVFTLLICTHDESHDHAEEAH